MSRTDWQQVPLGSLVARITSGATPQSGNERYYSESGGTPFAKIEDLTATNGWSIRDTVLRVSDAALRESALKIYPVGTILVSMYGTVGLVKVTGLPMAANQALAAIVPPFDCDERFLYHYLNWSRSGWDKYKAQTTQANINGAIVRSFVVRLPDRATQGRIAEILDTLDSRIATVELEIGKLCSLHHGLVESRMSAASSAKTPLRSHLVHSPKNGYSPKETDEWTGVLALGLGCLTNDGFRPRQLKNVPARDGRNSSALLNDGDLLMSRANTRELVGLIGIYRDIGMPCIYPDLMMRLTPTPACRPEFLELQLRSNSVRRQIQGIAQGTSESMVKISGSSVQGLSVSVPTLEEQDRILRTVHTSQKRIDIRRDERNKLKILKQGLMEDLLTGRVRVNAAEAVLEDL
ncbi:restriction endonuclease subunit S [Nonomuraea dietziae]|uniref:restriction endonuclease subunit S n=1 Tax=Nonomuraea dietziae TaxID=65515 RepID=UPI003406B689